ncbi:LuxR C-terminal-related transcriptional regulator [Streptomyces sp. NPDC057253]|uniref:LuxR C-terminal-related transcriptional regulator n=1 Tax=Streptomyces sp. NPDC057253 TaxID=3346069 RepID=UPI00362B2E55
MITVLLTDPHALHRLGLRTHLVAQPDLAIVGEATTGTETARMHERLRPDVVLLGSGLPPTDVTTTVRRLRQTRIPGFAPPHVLVLSSQDRDEHAHEVLRAGADGFLPATTTPGELIAALFTVAAGGAIVSPRLARTLIHVVCHDPRPEPPMPKCQLEVLTERERDVLRAVAAGRSNAEIAAQLSIATTTVKSHVRSILTKIGARARVQAVICAYESGLVRPPLTLDAPSLPAPHRMKNREELTCTYFSLRTTPPSPYRSNAA